MRILEDGTAVLNTGAVDNGQGSDTVLVQMCAASLGLEVGQVRLGFHSSSADGFGLTAEYIREGAKVKEKRWSRAVRDSTI